MTSQLYARQDGPILLPLSRPSSPIGLPTFRPLPPPRFGRPESSPLVGKPQGSPSFLIKILPRASTRLCSHISFPPPLLRPTLPSLSLPILTTFLSARRKLRSPFQSPPTLPLPALTRSLTTCGNGFIDHALPYSPNSSLLCYITDITPPP